MIRSYFARGAATVAASLFLVLTACAPTAPSDTGTPPKSFVVFFKLNSAELTAEAATVIEQVVAEVNRIKATGVAITGYSAPRGPQANQVRLSQERADAVEAQLIARNVPREIISKAHQGGDENVAGPIVEGQRVEVVVTRETRK
jgi:outer membrane protein OmpA-like peptidoglycan-associated protein